MAETRFNTWRGRWKTRREEISHHLGRIERVLEEAEDRSGVTPALTVIGLPATSEPVATFGF